MKSSSEVFDAINALEARFPVASWRSGDIDLWPTYRMRLYGDAMHRVFANEESSGLRRRLLGLFTRASRAILRVPVAWLRDYGHNASIRANTTAVFFTDGVSFVKLGDSWFDRVMDPVIEALEERGHRSLKLTPLAEVHVPRYLPSRFIQPALDRIKLMSSRSRVPVEAPEFESFRRAAVAAFGDSAPHLIWLQVQAARLHALTKWFERVLERTGARHAFVNTYYSLEGLAFTQAARRRGVRSIDLQHGMQGAHHPAYGRWVALPSRGYSTLPDEFWVWGKEESAAIEAWRNGCGTHTPRITGNFWLQRWSQGKDPTVRHFLGKARSLRNPQPGVTQVLVCLTWGVPESETDKLIDAARLAGPSFSWWWRLHPVYASQSAAFARRLVKAGLDGSQVAEATNAPLYALVRAADITVGHSSTVLQESADLGVPAVITSDYGAEVHARLLRSGAALHANEAPEIAAAVRKLASQRPAAMAAANVSSHSLEQAVEALLAPTPELSQHGAVA